MKSASDYAQKKLEGFQEENTAEPSSLSEYEEKILKERDNLERLESGVFMIKCPFDGKQFKGENITELVHREGVYRSKNFVNDSSIVHASNLKNNGNILKEWENEDAELSLSESEFKCVERILQVTVENPEKVQTSTED